MDVGKNFRGGPGDDFVKATKNDDLLDGGSGFDLLTYEDSFKSGSAFKGIVLDARKGTVIDCWGSKDIISNFEVYKGSKFDDVMRGSNGAFQSDTFAGLKGDDTMNGREGWDWVYYSDDQYHGGKRGVDVNLGAKVAKNGDIIGSAIDGWGDRDKLINIENVEGTQKKDKLWGSVEDNTFNGAGGSDSYNGKQGFDTVVYDTNFRHSSSLEAVRIDLALATQCQNDGFGNTETYKSVERFILSTEADIFAGDNNANVVMGYVGADTLSGRGGADVFEYGLISPFGGGGTDEFGDTITDFKSGQDHFRFYLTSAVTGGVNFGGMDATVRFANASSAQSNDSCFFYNAATHKLSWDGDGVGGSAAIVVATLPNLVGGLAASDIEIIA